MSKEKVFENIYNDFEDKKFAIAAFIRANESFEPLKDFIDMLSASHPMLTPYDASVLYNDIQFIKNEGVSLNMLFAQL